MAKTKWNPRIRSEEGETRSFLQTANSTLGHCVEKNIILLNRQTMLS